MNDDLDRVLLARPDNGCSTCGMPVFADLNQHHTTMHFPGQSILFDLTSDRAKGETYCLAHHVTVDGEGRQVMIAALR
ncbi:nuclear transport factor 2 family protein [Cupriavidus metallidurans]|jgi:hypothetical protein|uniref:Uncharacterized protein n=1 Tax=Cupriavidus metallidurans TaxID=119219 RepID=A0A482ITB2_9BURK|nr:hypothetical protein DDF84_009970 [Cupriavidus metallidurans]QWC87134.1 nuclear transport factor 2 family protein [Cupriavidus metallidurans]